MWKTNRNSSQLPRPPPGLTNQKQASPSPWSTVAGPRLGRNWGGGGGMNQESRYGPGNVLLGFPRWFWTDSALKKKTPERIAFVFVAESSCFSAGSAWSDGAGSRGSCWLLLSNLTPQVRSTESRAKPVNCVFPTAKCSTFCMFSRRLCVTPSDEGRPVC